MELKDYKTTSERHKYIIDFLQEVQRNFFDVTMEQGKLTRACVGEDPWICNAIHPDGVHYPFSINISVNAEGQLLNRLGIPASYIHKCPQELQAQNINYWLQLKPNRELFFRFSGQKSVRAIFSTRFSPQFDDVKIIPPMLQAMELEAGGAENLHIKSFYKHEEVTILRGLFLNATTDYKGTKFFAGVNIINSEIGKSAVWIKPIVRAGSVINNTYDYLDRSHEGSTRISHIGQLDLEHLTNAVKRAKEVAQVGIHRLIKAGVEEVLTPKEEFRKIFDQTDYLPLRILNFLEDEYKEVERSNKLQIARSILESVKQLPVFQRYLAECEVGRYLDLFNKTNQRLTDIARDID